MPPQYQYCHKYVFFQVVVDDHEAEGCFVGSILDTNKTLPQSRAESSSSLPSDSSADGSDSETEEVGAIKAWLL